jgi:hypothetical protein
MVWQLTGLLIGQEPEKLHQIIWLKPGHAAGAARWARRFSVPSAAIWRGDSSSFAKQSGRQAAHPMA